MSKNWSLRRDGADVHSDLTISLSQALLGGTIRVPGVNDEVVFTVGRCLLVVERRCCCTGELELYDPRAWR